MSVYSVLN